MEKKLSITIVAYHNYEDILNAVESMEHFTSEQIDKQIYIVDNSAPVDEAAINAATGFKRELEKYDDVEYIDVCENLGFGKGNNYILDRIDSQYHAIVNPDVIFVEDAFDKILKYMDENADIGMCIPQIVDESGKRQLVYRDEVTVFDMFIRMFLKPFFKKRMAAHTLQDKDYTKPFQVPFGQGSFLVIRSDLFKELNGFDDRFFMYLEDADLCKRVNQSSKLMYYPDAVVIHKWGQGSHKNLKLFKYHISSMIHYFNKWGWKIC